MRDNSLGDLQTMGGGEQRRVGYVLGAGEVLGQYRIIRPLGRGGMGEVYEAENTVNRKKYALKVLPRAATGGRGSVAARAIAARAEDGTRGTPWPTPAATMLAVTAYGSVAGRSAAAL